MQLLFFILGYFLLFYLLNSPKNQDLKKNVKKKHLDISSFYIFVPKFMVRMLYGSWDMVRDGRTDRQKKWHIEAGVSPKNIWNWELQLFPASIRNYKKLVFSCIHKKFWSRLSYQFFQQTQKSVFWGKYKKIFSGEGGLKTFSEENLIGWVCQAGLL